MELLTSANDRIESTPNSIEEQVPEPKTTPTNKSPTVARKPSPVPSSVKTTDATNAAAGTAAQAAAGFTLVNPVQPSTPESNPQFNEAISLIKKIKTRYADQPNNTVFKEFLEILNNYRSIQGDGDNEQTQLITV